MKIEGYITNLGKYNEGQLIGKWIEFPIDEDDLKKALEEIGINEEYEEYFITDYENNIFDFGEYTSIAEINETVEKYEELCEDNDEEIVNALFNEYNNLDDVENAFDNIKVYYNVDDMEDVAEQYVEETCMLENIPTDIAKYFDYKKLGDNMEYDGSWIWFGKNYKNVICVFH